MRFIEVQSLYKTLWSALDRLIHLDMETIKLGMLENFLKNIFFIEAL